VDPAAFVTKMVADFESPAKPLAALPPPERFALVIVGGAAVMATIGLVARALPPDAPLRDVAANVTFPRVADAVAPE
jgi:hypothetical protein